MKNFLANTTVNFEGYKFYIRAGDMLAHDAQHGNSLAVYHNGQLVKVIKVDSLTIEAFLKSGFIVEIKNAAKKPSVAPSADTGRDVPNEDPKPLEDITETIADTYVKTLPAPVEEIDLHSDEDKYAQYKKQKRRRAATEEVPIPEEFKDLIKDTPASDLLET